MNNIITDELICDILAGKYSWGPARKQRLIAAGYDYNEVQRAVNDSSQLKWIAEACKYTFCIAYQLQNAADNHYLIYRCANLRSLFGHLAEFATADARFYEKTTEQLESVSDFIDWFDKVVDTICIQAVSIIHDQTSTILFSR